MAIPEDRRFTDEDLRAIPSPITKTVGELSAADLESQERFREMVLAAVAETLRAESRYRFMRWGKDFETAKDMAADVVGTLFDPDSYQFRKAMKAARDALQRATDENRKPSRIDIVRFLGQVVRDLCHDHVRTDRRRAESRVADGDVSFRLREQVPLPDAIVAPERYESDLRLLQEMEETARRSGLEDPVGWRILELQFLDQLDFVTIAEILKEEGSYEPGLATVRGVRDRAGRFRERLGERLRKVR